MHIRVDFDNIITKIRPLHGVGQPPFVGANFEMFSYLKDAASPSRACTTWAALTAASDG